MRTMVHLKGIGRTAALAGILLSGPALVFAQVSGHDGHDKAAPAEAAPATASSHGHGHGQDPAGPAETPAAGHGGGYGAHSGWPEPGKLGGDYDPAADAVLLHRNRSSCLRPPHRCKRVRKEPGVRFACVPFAIVGPTCRKLAVAKSRAHTQHGVAPRYRIGADGSDKVAGQQRDSRSPWLTRDETFSDLRDCAEQAR